MLGKGSCPCKFERGNINVVPIPDIDFEPGCRPVASSSLSARASSPFFVTWRCVMVAENRYWPSCVGGGSFVMASSDRRKFGLLASFNN